jgi:hypothetical protein
MKSIYTKQFVILYTWATILNAVILFLFSTARYILLEDNIKMDLQEVGGGRGEWMDLAQDRDGWWALVSTVKNLRVPQKCGEFLD